MWVTWRRFTRGDISLRRFLLFAATIVMALFVVAPLFSTPVYAADATRDRGTVTYENRVYTRIDKEKFASDKKTKDLPIIGSSFDGYKMIQGDTLHLIVTTDDAESATSGTAVSYQLKNGVYDPSTQSETKSISIGGSASGEEEKTAENGENGGKKDTCAVENGVGWLVCPIMTFLADRMDDVMDILENFLTVRTLQTDTKDNPVYEIWQKVRDVSNICFIIAFMFVVYSQVTNFGLSSYGLKFMLPRLIVAAILVNVSYWLTGLVLDISNVLGMGLSDMFRAVRENLQGVEKAGSELSGLSWSAVAGSILAGGGALGGVVLAEGGIGPSLTLLVPFLLGILLAAFTALVILAARQALITLCILVSPLAFVAFVLPSTQKYFDKWKDLFLTMLMMFPIVSFVMGAAQLAGYAIILNAGDSPLQIILGMAVQIAPIAITPFLIRISGNLLGKIAGIINNPNRGLIDRTRNWAQDRAKYQAAKNRAGAPLIDKKNGRLTNNFLTRRSKKLKRAAERTADALNKAHSGDYPTGRFTSPTRHVNQAVRRRHRKKMRQQGLTTAYETMANNNATEKDNEQFGGSSVHSIEGNETARKSEIDNAFYASEAGQMLEARTRRASIRKTELDNAFDRNNHALLARQQEADIDKTRVQTEFNSSSIGRQVDVARRQADRNKQIVEQDLEKNWHELNLRDSSSQQQEMTLRVRSDQAAAKKKQVEAVYSDMKANVEGKIVGSRLDASVEAQLKQQAFDAAQITSATAGREAEATRVLNANINTQLLNNGKVYQKDASGKIVNDASGQPIVLSQHKIDGVTELHTYATGVGSRNVMLARARAQQAKDEETEADAAFTLMKYFNFGSNDYSALAYGGPGSSVTKTKGGNTITFNFDDEAAKTAAISWIAKNGAYSQKCALGLSGANGASNDGWSGFITRELIANGFSAMAPWANDITIDKMSRGLVQKKDIAFHSFREIMEGRIKPEKLAGANDGAIAELHKVFQSYAQDGDGWRELVNMYTNYLREDKGFDDARLANVEQNIRDIFSVRYGDLIDAHDEIENSDHLSKMANGQTINQLRRGYGEYSSSREGQAGLEHRRKLREARRRQRDGNATANDIALINKHDKLYRI